MPNSTARTEAAPWWGYALALFLVTGTFLWANLPVLKGDAVPIWDALNFYGPAYSLLADHARQGEFLLWNPWMNGGRPDGADPQIGSFSPWTVGIGFVTGGRLFGYVLYWLLTWWLGILGMVVLARHLRAPPWGAAVAAAAFFSSGFMTGHAQHMTFIYSQAFLPWIIWSLDLALEKRSLRGAAYTGGLWGLSALAGYPGLTVLNFGFAGLWSLGRLLWPRHPQDSDFRQAPLLRRLSWLAVFWLLATAVGGAVLSPSYVAFFSEGRSYSDRVEPLSKERAIGSNALPPEALVTMTSPHMASIKRANREMWGGARSSMVSIYSGAIALSLALTALLAAPRRPWHGWLFGVGLFFLLASMGQALPLRGWLYDLLPPLRFFRHSAGFRGQFVFVLAVLAIYGSRRLDVGARARQAWMLFGMIGAGSALALWIWLGQFLEPGVLTYTMRLEFARRLALALFLAAPLAAFFVWISPRRLTQRLMVGFLMIVALVDAWQAVELSGRTVRARHRGTVELWKASESAHCSRLDLNENGFERAARPGNAGHLNNHHLVAKEAVFESYDPLSSPYSLFWSSTEHVKAWVIGEDRLWFSERAEEIPVTWDGFRLMLAVTEERGEPILLVHPPGPTAPAETKALRAELNRQWLAQMRAVPPAERIAAQVLSYEARELTLRIETEKAGWLWITDRFTAGWRATVNGESRPVRQANFLFRAVEVPAGRSEIRFLYRPAYFPWLVMLSWGLLGLLVIDLILRRET